MDRDSLSVIWDDNWQNIPSETLFMVTVSTQPTLSPHASARYAELTRDDVEGRGYLIHEGDISQATFRYLLESNGKFVCRDSNRAGMEFYSHPVKKCR
jgi:hypothetical protein